MSIRARRQSPAIENLPVYVERQAAIDSRIVRLCSVLTLQQIDRPARAVLGHRQVCNADIKEVSALELQIPKIERTVACGVDYADFDSMRTIGQDLFRSEFSLRIDWNLTPRYPNSVVRRYAV